MTSGGQSNREDLRMRMTFFYQNLNNSGKSHIPLNTRNGGVGDLWATEVMQYLPTTADSRPETSATTGGLASRPNLRRSSLTNANWPVNIAAVRPKQATGLSLTQQDSFDVIDDSTVIKFNSKCVYDVRKDGQFLPQAAYNKDLKMRGHH